MSVLDGPRREHRRILLDARPQWCEPEGDALALPDGRRLPERDAVHLPPCEPSKILCVHLNYRSRAVEFGRSLEGETPTWFQKPVSALNAHRGALVRPADCHWLNYEGEIAAVVGRPMKNVSPARSGIAWPASRLPTTWARTTSAAPTPAPCCGSRGWTGSARSAPASCGERT